MADLSDKSVLVYDYGSNITLAERLTREFGEVLYYRPWKQADAKTNDKIIGEGIEGVTVVEHFYDVVHRPDLFIFPHIYDGDLQVDLVNRGKRVWGARRGDIYETDRMAFKRALKDVGLPVVPFKRCRGITALREYLLENEDKWVKTDMRGDGETWHHQTYQLSAAKLDAMAYFYGPAKEDVGFIIDDPIDSIIEVAYDGYMITSPDGQPQFPNIGFEGYEDKNMAHILAAAPYSDLGETVREVNDQFAPLLAKYFFRGAWGTEIKQCEEPTEFYFIDATCRQPSPPGQIIMEQVTNLGEFMYEGAEGNLIPIEIEEKVGVQLQLHSSWAGANHEPIQVPEKDRRWYKIEDCYRDEDGIDWAVHASPDDPIQGWKKIVGSVVALGPDIKTAVELVIERAKELKSFDCSYQTSCLLECLKRIEEGEKNGVPFPVSAPKPKELLDVVG